MAHGAAMIVEDHAGRVLLLRRSPTASWMPYRWNLPGGHVDPGETSTRAAIREAREEAGIRVDALLPIVRLYVGHHIVDFFYAERWRGRVRLNHESMDVAWVPRDVVWRSDLIPPQREALQQYLERR